MYSSFLLQYYFLRQTLPNVLVAFAEWLTIHRPSIGKESVYIYLLTYTHVYVHIQIYMCVSIKRGNVWYIFNSYFCNRIMTNVVTKILYKYVRHRRHWVKENHLQPRLKKDFTHVKCYPFFAI